MEEAQDKNMHGIYYWKEFHLISMENPHSLKWIVNKLKEKYLAYLENFLKIKSKFCFGFMQFYIYFH